MIEKLFKEGKEYKEGTPILFMMVGLPASGKSTIAAKLCQDYDAVWNSSDGIRKEIYGDAAIQDDPKRVFEIMRSRTKEAIKNGKNVVYDATNLASKTRRLTIRNCTERFDCWKVAYLVLTDFKECRRRNSERERKVPEGAMEMMFKQFTAPWWGEGWDEIIIEKTDETTYLMQDLLIPLMDMPHENHHHNQTIGEHLFTVARSKKMNTPFLKNTALLHDIGKGFCKTFVNPNGNKTAEAHYYGHANVSAYMSLFVKDRLPWEKKMKRAVLIQYHMEHYGRNEKGMAGLKRELGLSLWEMLERLVEADKERAEV